MGKKTDTPTKAPTRMDLPDVARFMATVADAELDRLADEYRAAADDLADLTKRHDVGRRKLEGVDGALGEARGADLDALRGQRASAAADVAAVGIALAGAQRRHTTACLTWATRLRVVATAEAQAAYDAIDAALTASKDDRKLLMQADGDSRVRLALGDVRLAAICKRVASATADNRRHQERGDKCRLVANIAAHIIERTTEIDERRAAA